MESQGQTDVEMSINGITYIWPVYVAPIGDDFLLGADFLEEHDVTVNLRKGLKIKGAWVECDIEKRPSRLERVTLPKPWTIQANHQAMCTIPREDDLVVSSKYAILEPVIEDTREIVVARILIDTTLLNIPVRCTNLSQEPITLQKGYVIGALHEVTEVLGGTPEKEQGEPVHL